MLSPRRGTERAFTLVELLVAMVLLALVLGTVISLVLASHDSSGSARARQKAQAQADDVTRQLADDLRATISPDRANPDLIATRDELRLRLGLRSVDIGDQILLMNGRENVVIDPQDVLEATPTALTIRSGSVPGTGRSGCIRWEVFTSGGTSSLIRTVFPDWRICSSTNRFIFDFQSFTWGLMGIVPSDVIQDRVAMLRPGSSPNVFTYSYYASSGTNQCETRVDRPSWMPLWEFENRLAAVKVNLGAFTSEAELVGTQRARAQVTIASRTTDQYLYALGCTP